MLKLGLYLHIFHFSVMIAAILEHHDVVCVPGVPQFNSL